MDPLITFQTTRLPEYRRGSLWYLSLSLAYLTLLYYFFYIDYSLSSFSALGIAGLVYYYFIFRPANPIMQVSFFNDGIHIRKTFLKYESCQSYTFLQQTLGRPAVLIVFSKYIPYLIPLPTGANIPSIDGLLHEKIKKTAKVPLIYSLCHTFKF